MEQLYIINMSSLIIYLPIRFVEMENGKVNKI